MRCSRASLLYFITVALISGFLTAASVSRSTQPSCPPVETPSVTGAALHSKVKTPTYQSPCSSSVFPNTGKRVRAAILDTKFDIYVYDHASVGDIVSGSIKRTGAWEQTETERIMKLLPKNGTGVLLDVGANIGWFSLTALHLGHKVVSFEPFESNIGLICASAMLMPSEALGFRLYNAGLDYRTRTCELFQKKIQNIGDTHSVCDPASRTQFLEKDYAPLGWMNTTTLDIALLNGYFEFTDHIDVMKVDVEGFEHSVIDGGNAFFTSDYAPKYVFIELVSKMMGDAGGMNERGPHRLISVLLRLANYGYELVTSSGAHEGVSLQTSSIESVMKNVDGKTVLLVHTQKHE